MNQETRLKETISVLVVVCDIHLTSIFFHQQIETVKILNDDAIVYTQHTVHVDAARQNTRRISRNNFFKTKRIEKKLSLIVHFFFKNL